MTPEVRAVIEAAERVCAATDPGEERRLGEALHGLARTLSILDRLEHSSRLCAGPTPYCDEDCVPCDGSCS